MGTDSSDVDFERDMPLTSADIEALARARKLRPLPTTEYLDWLTLMTENGVARRETNSDSDEPFEL
ncbi:MAG: hypothetical protein M3Q69_15905 [Acidobacteriota bacterium]|nr:hypothetical protein [Acidobacteriota bacterium]